MKSRMLVPVVGSFLLVACGAPHATGRARPSALASGTFVLKLNSGTSFLKSGPVSASTLAPEQKCLIPQGSTIRATDAIEGIRTAHVRLGHIDSITGPTGVRITCPEGISWIWLPHFTGFPSDLAGPRDDLDAVLERIRQAGLRKSPGGKIGLATLWLPTQNRKAAFANANEIFNSLSSAKWLWTAAALARQSVGTIEPLARKVFLTSDNVAAGELIRLAGGIEAVNSFLHGKISGTSEWNLCKWDYVAGLGNHCARNVFSPRSALQFLSAVYDKTLGLSAERAGALDSWSRLSPRSGYGGWIGTELPERVRETMSHKAGWYMPNINEIAIVQPENGGAYAIAMSIEGSTQQKSEAAIGHMSCLVYHAFNEPNRDPFLNCSPAP